MKFDARGAIELFFVDASGNLYLVMADSQNGENEDAYAGTKSYRLIKFDVNGNLAYEQVINQGDLDVFYPGYLAADGKGRAYVGRMDVMTGNCPDIIDFHFLDPGPLFDKGVMEDLYPWLEKSERISKDFL